MAESPLQDQAVAPTLSMEQLAELKNIVVEELTKHLAPMLNFKALALTKKVRSLRKKLIKARLIYRRL